MGETPGKSEYTPPYTKEEEEEIKKIKDEYNIQKEKYTRYYCSICGSKWTTKDKHLEHLESPEHKTARVFKCEELKKLKETDFDEFLYEYIEAYDTSNIEIILNGLENYKTTWGL